MKENFRKVPMSKAPVDFRIPLKALKLMRLSLLLGKWRILTENLRFFEPPTYWVFSRKAKVLLPLFLLTVVLQVFRIH